MAFFSYSKPTQGFTLVELSIVLVIIGLVIGGAMVGRDMIRTSTQRQFISQVEKFNTATLTFKLKYNCVPGDCTAAQASSFGITKHPLIASSNGNGNSRICERNGTVQLPVVPTSTRFECLNYWWHLSYTGLIDWSTSDTTSYCNDASVFKYGEHTPPVPFRGRPASGDNVECNGFLIVGPGEMNYGGDPFMNKSHAFLSMSSFANTTALPSGHQMGIDRSYPKEATMTPLDAFVIDTKLDDGLPYSGNIRAIGVYQDTTTGSSKGTTAPFRGAAGGVVCVNTDTTPNSYNVSSNRRTCNLSIEAAF